MWFELANDAKKRDIIRDVSENIINKILYKLDALKQIDTSFMINLYKAL